MKGREEDRLSGFARSLGLIAAAGLVGRLLFLYASRGWDVGGDGYAYQIEAKRLASEHIIQGSLHPPAWTFFMAVPPALSLDGLGYQQVMTAIIGTTTIVVTGLAGRKAFGPRIGLIAAGLAAVYANLWLYEREVLSEPLSVLMVATTILAFFWFREAPSTRRVALLGLLVGFMALVRSELILASVLMVTPLILATADVAWRKRIGWLALAGAVAVAMILPWAAYNGSRYEHPVFLSSGLGPAMRVGNCRPAYKGKLLGYYEFGCVTFVKDLSTDPSVSDAQLRRAAIEFMVDDPVKAAQVSVIRLGRTWNVYRPFQQVHFETERGSPVWVIRLAMFSYWALLPLAVAGAVLTRRRGVPLYPFLVFPLIVVVAVLPTIGTVRYRATAEIVIVLLAAVTLDRVLTWLRTVRTP